MKNLHKDLGNAVDPSEADPPNHHHIVAIITAELSGHGHDGFIQYNPRQSHITESVLVFETSNIYAAHVHTENTIDCAQLIQATASPNVSIVYDNCEWQL